MSARENIAAIILAAGRASRFVGDNEHDTKLIAPFRGAPLVRHAVKAVLNAGADPIILVTGHAREKILAAVLDEPVTEAFNRDFANGLASSVRVGIERLPQNCDGALIVLGDMPLASTNLVRDLMTAFTQSDVDAVAPAFEGRRGNPVLLGATLFAEARQLSGDEGARKLLRREHIRVLEIATNERGTVLDIDTQADLAQMSNESF